MDEVLPDKPVIQYHDVTAAAYRIRGGVRVTPLEVRDITNTMLNLLMQHPCKNMYT